VELNPLVLVGGAVAAVAAYAFSEKKKTEDTLVAQALPVAAQQVQMGVPVQQAAQQAATQTVINLAVKNAVPVAAQLIKAGTPLSVALDAATKGTAGNVTFIQNQLGKVKVEGDPNAGPWRVSWIFHPPFGRPAEEWIRYFATQAEAQSFASFEVITRMYADGGGAEVTGLVNMRAPGK